MLCLQREEISASQASSIKDRFHFARENILATLSRARVHRVVISKATRILGPHGMQTPGIYSFLQFEEYECSLTAIFAITKPTGFQVESHYHPCHVEATARHPIK